MNTCSSTATDECAGKHDKPLYLCEELAKNGISPKKNEDKSVIHNAAGGTFIVQLPDCLTTFTVSMLYLLMRSFSGLSLVKPFTSCACDSSRFLVCFGRLEDDKVGALWLSEVRTQCKSIYPQGGPGRGVRGSTGGQGGWVAQGLPQSCHACATQLQ